MVRLDLRKVLAEERQRRKTATPIASTDATETSKRYERHQLLHLDSYAVGQDRLRGLYFIPNALSEDDERDILAAIDAAPASRWTRGDGSSGRRMQNWGGLPGSSTITEALPLFLQSVVDQLVDGGVLAKNEAPNHCLINEYACGAACAMHQDGPLYLDKVATLTLGGPALIAFHRCLPDGAAGDKVTEVLLQPRCCLVVSRDAYSGHQHVIEARAEDVVSGMCCNLAAAGVAVGQRVARAERRISLVFVRKLSHT